MEMYLVIDFVNFVTIVHFSDYELITNQTNYRKMISAFRHIMYREQWFEMKKSNGIPNVEEKNVNIKERKTTKITTTTTTIKSNIEAHISEVQCLP